MISKVTNLQPQLKAFARLLPNVSRAYFSATPAESQPIEQTLQKEQEQKDEKNEDLAFKFEREWKKLYDERNASYPTSFFA